VRRPGRIASPGRGALVWLLGGALLIAFTIAMTAWSVERALRSALAEVNEVAPAAMANP
jgi:hypothetical protein